MSSGQSHKCPFYDLIAYRIKIPTPMDCNTFFTFNFSVNGGGGSVKFDMMLFDCNGEGEKWY
jgi:hypothetical protein